MLGTTNGGLFALCFGSLRLFRGLLAFTFLAFELIVRSSRHIRPFDPSNETIPQLGYQPILTATVKASSIRETFFPANAMPTIRPELVKAALAS